MIRLRQIDKSTKHLTGRLIISCNEKIIFPSSESIFLKKLEEKIVSSTKDFEHGGIKLSFLEIKIK